MTGYIITVALQHLHTVVHTETQTWHKSQATKDLEDSLSQVQAWSWLVLIFLGLSFGCLATIWLGSTVEDMQRSSLTETSIKSTQTK